MKNSTRIVLLAVSALLAVSCMTSCYSIKGEFDEELQAEITFSPMTDVATKAPLTSFPNGRTMVVTARYFPDGTINTGSAVNYFPATVYTYSTSNGYASSSGSAVHYWPLDGTGTLNFFAYSTALSTYSITWNSNYTTGVTFTTSDNSSTQDDILVGSRKGATRTATNGNQITFKHAQALLVFEAASSVAYNSTNNCGVTLTGITLNATAHQGTLSASRADDGATGVFTSINWSTSTGNNKNGITIPGSNTSRNLTGSYQSLGAGIMVPKQTNNGQYIIISYTLHNGKDASNNNIDIPMTYQYSLDGTGWTPGSKFTYQIYFNLNAITVTTSVSDWGNGGTSSISI